jgi:thiol-disulfide isomerase/thioredoxin
MSIAALSLLLLQTPAQAERPYALMVGDPAPALKVKEWVQGEPVAGFEPGMVYVVEFWATWCGPCRVAIPHINELSHTYAGRARFVGVSVWEHLDRGPYKVPEFVEEMGDKLTYTVGADRVADADPAVMADTWMTAAGQSGIPTAFIVDTQGRVAWIGHPMRMDGPLADVVAGKWDIEAAAREHATAMIVKGLSNQLRREVTKAKKDKDWDAAIAAIDTAVKEHPVIEPTFCIERYFLLLDAGRGNEAAVYGMRIVDDLQKDSASYLNTLAWSIIDPHAARADGDLKLALHAAERAAELAAEDPNVLDTLGLALFRAGQVERAISVQEKAVSLAKGTPNEADLQGRLDEFRAARGRRQP